MEDKFILMYHFDGEIEMPTLHETLDEAHKAIKESLIHAMEGSDDSVFEEYDGSYFWESDGDYAWFDSDHGRHAWRIVSIKELEEYSKQTLGEAEGVL